MVEEGSATQNKQPKTKYARPKPVFSWTVNDVQKWLKRHCSEYADYHSKFAEHEITGRALLRLTDDSLERLGVLDDDHRNAILREILKQRLKTNIMEIKDLELANNIYENTNSK